MAAFDTIYHHELTERLAWRPSQRHELKLHAARSFIYAALFVVLGFLELHGVFAMLVIAALVDRGVHHARGLHRGGHEPQAAGERARQPHAARDQLRRHPGAGGAGAGRLGAASRPPIKLVSHGYWSALMAFAAFGAVIFGLRDLLRFAPARAGRRRRRRTW